MRYIWIGVSGRSSQRGFFLMVEIAFLKMLWGFLGEFDCRRSLMISLVVRIGPCLSGRV